MGLEELKKQIAKDMEEQIKEIEKQTSLESKELLSQATKQVKDYEKQKQEETQKQIAELTRREEALVELEGNKLVQEAKREAINAVFASLKEKLQTLPAKERSTIIKDLIAKAKTEIDVATVYVNKDDVPSIKNAKSEEIMGGVIAENKDGSVRVDYSFDSLLQEFRQEMLSTLSEKLF